MTVSRILTCIFSSVAILAAPLALASNSLPGQAVVGVSIGYESRSGTLNSDYFSTPQSPALLLGVAPSGTQVAVDSEKLSDSGTVYGILGGYQVWCNDFFVGAEGYVDFGRYEQVKLHHKTTNTIAATFQLPSEAEYTVRTRVGGYLRGGMKLPPFFTPYVKAGVEYAKHEVSVTNIIVAGAPIPFDHYSEDRGFWTFLVGAGVEVPLFSEKTSLRLEYIYKPGNTFGFDDPFDTLAAFHDIKVRSHAGKLIWTFYLG